MTNQTSLDKCTSCGAVHSETPSDSWSCGNCGYCTQEDVLGCDGCHFEQTCK